MEKMIDKNSSIGIAGEFFVAAELTRRGYVASLTSKNTKAIDILVSKHVTFYQLHKRSNLSHPKSLYHYYL